MLPSQRMARCNRFSCFGDLARFLIITFVAFYIGGFTVSFAENISSNKSVPSMKFAGEKNPFNVKITHYPQEIQSINKDIADLHETVKTPDPFFINLVDNSDPVTESKAADLFIIIVNEDLQVSLSASLEQYMNDIAYDGFRVELYTASGGTEKDLKSFLQDKYFTQQLTGAVLIGDLPNAYFEMVRCFSYITYEGFPDDLYFMDMDGDWLDNDSNGIYDYHGGHEIPEIFIGRLQASLLNHLGSTEEALMQNYFRKNHLYRTGQLSVEKRAMLYVDDDWQDIASEWYDNLNLAYNAIITQLDPKSTTAEAYRYNLEREHEFVHLAVHSYPSEHWFKVPPDMWQGIFDYRDLIATNPRALFYMLYACSITRYISPNYLAGWYIFNPSYGLVAIGSSKIGGMLDYGDFYQALGENRTFGQAYLEWFQSRGGTIFDDWEKCFYYGLILCGDPLLKLDMLHSPLTLQIENSEVYNYGYRQNVDMRLSAVGGIPPYRWELISGNLPNGTSFDSSTAIISGVADKIGCYELAFGVTDSDTLHHRDSIEIQISVACEGGDANNDGVINIGDIVFLNHFVFHQGPAPGSEDEADINCDGAVNFADIIVLVNHIFKTHSLNPCENL